MVEKERTQPMMKTGQYRCCDATTTPPVLQSGVVGWQSNKTRFFYVLIFYWKVYIFIYILFVILLASFRHMGKNDLHDKSKEREQRFTILNRPATEFLLIYSTLRIAFMF